MSPTPKQQQLVFRSRLERLAEGINYFAVPVPAKTTAALGTHGPVAVWARVNGGSPFQVSLYPKGGGRHGMRLKASVRAEAKIDEGDEVQVEITVVDPQAEIALPADVARALRAAGALDAFQALPPGERRYTLRVIDEAVRPETRSKRIAEAITAARARAAKRVDR